MSDSTGTRFVVQWEEHPAHLASRLGQLLETQTLVDVTLMCNTHTLRVHRSVLAACSPYFENLLHNIAMRQLVHHPLIVLKDMQFSVLKCMIEFMYCGETNVTEEDLGPLLQAARFFQVKGLSSMTKEALGLPPRATTKPKVNGEVPKPAPKAAPKAVSTSVSHKSSGSGIAGMTMVSKQQPVKTFAVRESPGLRAVSNDPAELLLSLSDAGNLSRAPMFLTQPQPAKMTPVTTKQVVTSQPRSWTTRPVGAAVDSSFQLAPNQPEGASPVYQPGPRKRGRPLKRQMNLIFQEKVISDTEMALRKEAEASRRALETLQKEMNSEIEEADVKPMIVHQPQQPQQRTQPQQQQQQAQSAPQQLVQPGLVMKSKLVSVSQTSKVVAPTPAPAPTPTVAAVPAAVPKKTETATTNTSVTIDEGDTITYQISDSGNGPVMTRYMEALKDAGLPTDVPILIDSGDGSYVQVNEEVLMNIVNGGGLSYQVTAEQLQDVHKQQEGEILVTSGDESAQLQQQQQQLVRYVDDNGDIVEGVLAVVQEGEGTTVAVTPSGQVLQIQGGGETETYQLMEGPAESNNEGLVSGDLEPPTEQELATAAVEEENSTNKRSSLDDADACATKKMKVDGSN